MPWYAPHDAREFTDYLPACQANHMIAKRMGAKNFMQYRKALVSKDARKVVGKFLDTPKPGSDLKRRGAH